MHSTLATVRWVTNQLPFETNVVELADFVVIEMSVEDIRKWKDYLWTGQFSPEVSGAIENSLVQTNWNSWRQRAAVMIPKRSDER